MRFTLAGRPDVALGNVTSDANGMVTDLPVSIPAIPAHPKYTLFAKPASGTTPKTEVAVSWYACLRWDRFNPDSRVRGAVRA